MTTLAEIRDELKGDKPATVFAWLIEAPGPRYLAVSQTGARWWTTDHDTAIRFRDKQQCVAMISALRTLDPVLFAFEASLTRAQAVEHGWG